LRNAGNGRIGFAADSLWQIGQEKVFISGPVTRLTRLQGGNRTGESYENAVRWLGSSAHNLSAMRQLAE